MPPAPPGRPAGPGSSGPPHKGTVSTCAPQQWLPRGPARLVWSEPRLSEVVFGHTFEKYSLVLIQSNLTTR